MMENLQGKICDSLSIPARAHVNNDTGILLMKHLAMRDYRARIPKPIEFGLLKLWSSNQSVLQFCKKCKYFQAANLDFS